MSQQNNPGVYPRFYIDPVQDHVASEREGRPIFRDVERVEIIIAGNQYTKPIENVTNEHRARWPKEYEAFKAGIELSPEGTPLEEWPILKRSQILELKALGFKTVEHIRDMSDQAIQRIGMGGRQLKGLAEGFLDDAARVAETNRLAKDNERKDAQIAALQMQVEEMGRIMNERFAELQTLKDAPSPLLTTIPGMTDPAEHARQALPLDVAQSSLGDLARPSRRQRRAQGTEQAEAL